MHAVDLLCWLNGGAPEEVYATGGQVTHPGQLASPDLIDTAAATLRFPGGAVATLLVSDAGLNPFASKWLFQAYDGQQSAVVYDHGRTVAFGDPAGPGDGPAETAETLAPPPLARFPCLLDAIRSGGGAIRAGLRRDRRHPGRGAPQRGDPDRAPAAGGGTSGGRPAQPGGGLSLRRRGGRPRGPGSWPASPGCGP